METEWDWGRSGGKGGSRVGTEGVRAVVGWGRSGGEGGSEMRDGVRGCGKGDRDERCLNGRKKDNFTEISLAETVYCFIHQSVSLFSINCCCGG